MSVAVMLIKSGLYDFPKPLLVQMMLSNIAILSFIEKLLYLRIFLINAS
jgi:hypothetical protein